jgi:lipoprotein LprG
MLRRLAAVLAVVALALSACGSPAVPALTDPKDILTKSIAALATVKTAHLHADISGSFNADLTGSGSAAAIDLKGTSADGDIDVPNKKIHLGFSAPALLGLSGDLIQIGTDQYVKISLTGPKYKKQTTSATTSAATDPQKAIDELKAGLDKLAAPPVKDPDERCGDKDCYKVTIKLSAADLGAAASSLGSFAGDATLDVWVQKDDLKPAKLATSVNAGTQGSVTVTLTLSNYDKSVTIDAPPADQVQ